MKKKVKQYVRQIEAAAEDRHIVLKDFSRMLDKQVLKYIKQGGSTVRANMAILRTMYNCESIGRNCECI